MQLHPAGEVEQLTPVVVAVLPPVPPPVLVLPPDAVDAGGADPPSPVIPPVPELPPEPFPQALDPPVA